MTMFSLDSIANMIIHTQVKWLSTVTLLPLLMSHTILLLLVCILSWKSPISKWLYFDHFPQQRKYNKTIIKIDQIVIRKKNGLNGI